MNNPAVIIGAMIIAPLMDPILGLAFFSQIREWRQMLLSGLAVASGVALAVGVSALLTLPVTLLSITDEVMGRTQPSLLDLGVALATGFVAGYARIRSRIGGSLYGVAISISLVPPLCTVGIGLANESLDIASGAALLFLTNLVSILFSGSLAFLLLDPGHYRRSLKSLLVPTLFLLVLAIPLSISFLALQTKRVLEAELSELLRYQTYTFRRLSITEIKMDLYRKPAWVKVTVQGAPESITPKQVQLVEAALSRKAEIPIQLTVDLVPTQRFPEPASPAESLLAPRSNS
jgi:uncharacterized hydrophobic protein (TIGR00271 family)